MQATVSISDGKVTFPALVKAAENGAVVTVTRRKKPVAWIIGHKRLSAIAETMELMNSPAIMQAISEYEAGKTKFVSIDAIID